MAKKVEVEIDIKGGEKVKGLGQEIRELTKQLRNTPEGTKEWSQIYNKIDDLKDKMAAAKATSKDWIDSLESAGGPLGALGAGLNKLKVSTVSFGAALKATGIGLVVAAIGLLVAAFAKTEGSMKKLEPIMIMLEKLFAGLVEAFQPVLDLFLDLAMKVLPYAITYIKNFYGSLMALFTLVKEAGVGVGKILKGIFTLDTKSLEEGFNQIKGSWDKAKQSFNQFTDNFEKGYAKQTKTQKKNAEDAQAIADKALADKLKRMDADDKLDAAQLEKLKEQTLALATTEQQKLDIETAFAKKSYDMKIKDINDKMALYKKDSVDYKNLLADRIKVEGDYIKETTGFADKQTEIDKKKKEEKKIEELAELKQQLGEKQLTQEQYEDAVYQTEKKYAEDKKQLADIESKRTDQILERKKKKAEEERSIILQSIQNQINELDRLNTLKLNDYNKDLERLAEKKLKLDEAEKLELANTELTEYEKTVIKQKYADKRKEISQQEIDTARAYKQAQIDGITQTLDSLASVTSAVASLYDEEAKTSKSAFDKRKKLQIATALMSAASGIIQILTQPSTLPSPFDWITKGLNVIALGIATGANIKKINSTQFEGASGGASAAAAPPPNANLGKNYAEGGLLNGPRHAAGGMMINAEGGEAVMTRGAVTAFGPLLSQLNQAGGGKSFGAGQNQGAAYDNPRVQKITPEPVIVKTYVVSNELTTEQEKQAKLKSLSTL
jgi:hypothetical protein